LEFSGQHPFEIRIEPCGKAVLVHVAGEFDLSSREKFEAGLSDVISAKPVELILDLRDVLFIDSTGLRLVLEAWSESRRAGFDFAVLQGNGQVERIFRETGLDETIPIVPGIPSADPYARAPRDL
jgi:anti-anti-sigma factor